MAYAELMELAQTIPGYCLHWASPETRATCQSHDFCGRCAHPIKHSARAEHEPWCLAQAEIRQRDAEALAIPAGSDPIDPDATDDWPETEDLPATEPPGTKIGGES